MNSRRALLVSLFAALLICNSMPTGAAVTKDPGSKKEPMAKTGKVSPAHFVLYGLIEQFQWKEFVDGNEILEEKGPLFGAGGSLDAVLRKQLHLEANAEFFLGQVDYDGHNQAGVPAKTDVDYTGIQMEGDLAYHKALAPTFTIKPYGGVGGRFWKRNIKSGHDELGGELQGYEENWTTLYLRAGLAGIIQPQNNMQFFGKFSLRMPFYNQNKIDLFGSDIEVEPGLKMSLSVEAGINYKQLTASVFYDDYNFSESDKVGTLELFQPESEAKIFGAKAGITF